MVRQRFDLEPTVTTFFRSSSQYIDQIRIRGLEPWEQRMAGSLEECSDGASDHVGSPYEEPVNRQ